MLFGSETSNDFELKLWVFTCLRFHGSKSVGGFYDVSVQRTEFRFGIDCRARSWRNFVPLLQRKFNVVFTGAASGRTSLTFLTQSADLFDTIPSTPVSHTLFLCSGIPKYCSIAGNELIFSYRNYHRRFSTKWLRLIAYCMAVVKYVIYNAQNKRCY
jgi:hypothetical protein